MGRSRHCLVCLLRLSVYLAALWLVLHATAASPAARLALPSPTASEYPAVCLAVLLLGALLELVIGAARWR